MNNDAQFQDHVISNVKVSDGGWSVTFEDGWSFWVPETSPVPPAKGMTARLYGKGFGYIIRGLLLDGRVVFYRTEDEDVVFRNNQRYGATAEEWLQRWNEGKIVWSVEMGGFGPGYEQCIQITAATILGHLLDAKPDMEKAQNDSEYWNEVKDGIDAAIKPVGEKLGLTGGQCGAAKNLAMSLYRRGPVCALSDPAVKDRLIQVSKSFPSI